jgi:2',3'-cyclic-nucleotide 2'-phosphodiesterase
MKILVIGDIVGSPGRSIVQRALAAITARHEIDYTIANAENAAGGFGVTKEICEELLDLGIDCLTSGNHIWDKKEILPFIDLIPQLIRPANYPVGQPGRGWYVGKSRRGGVAVATLNLSGRVFMGSSVDDPFRAADALLDELKGQAPVLIVDIHAEATSEKLALGHHLDGRVSAVLGTHTHVPTCDHRVLPKGTAYCTDIGMTGPYDSVIGVETAVILKRFLTGLPVRFETAKGDPRLAAVVITVDPVSGKAQAIERMLLSESDL